jgi:membrane peptidoglycan carboxypeptidase
MTFRKLIATIAKRIYRRDYVLLKERIEKTYQNHKATENLDDELTKFLISGEDHRFRYHLGFDLIAILRAIKNRVLYGKIEGASTIEQQLVRVLTNDFKRTLSRKIKEIFLATTLSEFAPRNRIPIIYLNIAFFGTGMKGLREALPKIMAKVQNNDSKSICAELIARLKYPEPRNITPLRKLQIERRKAHLINLRTKHELRKFIKVYG